MSGPLQDVRIIAVEQYGAGPWGSVHLADLGADIIKIEDPGSGGDVGRYVPPFQEGGDSLFFETFNRNKRSLALDMSSSAGREVFRALVKEADVVYSNLRGDVPAKLGLRYEDLKDVNPAVVCCSLSAFGMTGPRASDPGYDYVLQGLTGWMSLTGEPGGPPVKTGLSLVDFSGGLVAGIAILAGLHAARRDGVGMDCDLSLFDTAVGLLSYVATWNLTRGLEPARTRHSAHPSLVPFQNFATSTGWIVVACAKEKFFGRLVRAMGRHDLTEDPRCADFSARDRNREWLIEELETEFRKRPTDEWLRVLSEVGVPCGPVNDVATGLEDPQVAARGLIVETEHPRLGTVRQVASPVRVGDPRTAHRRAPRLGEDAEEILHGLLGLDAERVEDLRRSGAFGAPPGT
jgi:crotonobetainyl-CoA:carnitine CoA-transferase CaiB-like acyl-CoA transferase